MAVKIAKLTLIACSIVLVAATLLVAPPRALADDNPEAASVQEVDDDSGSAKNKSAFQKRLEDKKRKSEAALQIGSEVPKSTDMAESFVKGLIYCIVVFVVLSYINRYLRSKKENSTSAAIELISRRSIGNRMSLLLVEVEGRKFFLSQTNDMVQMLAPLSDPLGLSEGFTDDMVCQSQMNSEDYEIPRAVHE